MLHRLESSSDNKTRARLWPALRRELASHEEAEVAIVPAPSRSTSKRVAGVASRRGSAAALALDRQDRRMDVDDPMWTAALQEPAHGRHHVQEEEKNIFPAEPTCFRSGGGQKRS